MATIVSQEREKKLVKLEVKDEQTALVAAALRSAGTAALNGTVLQPLLIVFIRQAFSKY